MTLAFGMPWFSLRNITYRYAIPKIKMLRNLSCLKARFKLLRNKLSTAQQHEPRFKTAYVM